MIGNEIKRDAYGKKRPKEKNNSNWPGGADDTWDTGKYRSYGTGGRYRE